MMAARRRLAALAGGLWMLQTDAAAARDAAGFLARAEAASRAPVAACEPVRPAIDGTVRESTLPSRIVGAAAGATGGLGRAFHLVTSDSDGPGAERDPATLRGAVESARRQGGGWIGFAPELRGRTIRLERGLRPGANVTLDGGCGGITLRAPARETILRIEAANVIVSGLTFTKDAYAEPEDRTGDAIGLAGEFDRVAILNNAFTRCGDGCIDVVRRHESPRLAAVTIAFNRIATHNKVMLVGALSCTAQRSIPACARPLEALGGDLPPAIRVTLLGNLMAGTSQRHPKVVANAIVHSVNNLVVLSPTTYGDGRMSATYGGAAASGGLLASDSDVIVNPSRQGRLGMGPVSAAREGGGPEADGAVRIVGSVAVGALRMVEHAPDIVRAEIARMPPVVTLDAARDPEAFAACLLRIAGPQGAATAWPDGCETVPRRVSHATIATNPNQSTRAVVERLP